MESLALPGSGAWRKYVSQKGLSPPILRCVFHGLSAVLPFGLPDLKARSADRLEDIMELSSLGALKRRCGRFAGFGVEFVCNFLSICTEEVSQKGRLFVWSVSNTQRIVRRVCEILSAISFSICGDSNPRARRQKRLRGVDERTLHRLRGNWETLKSGEHQKSPNSQGVAHEDGEVCRTRCTGHSMVEELQKFSTRRTGLSACKWTGLGWRDELRSCCLREQAL
jgi:phage-related protein